MRKPNYRKIEQSINAVCFEAKSIEREIEIAETSKIPIDATSPVLYTARKDGVIPETNIRADRFAQAQELMNAAAKATTAKRQEYIKANMNPDNETAQA